MRAKSLCAVLVVAREGAYPGCPAPRVWVGVLVSLSALAVGAVAVCRCGEPVRVWSSREAKALARRGAASALAMGRGGLRHRRRARDSQRTCGSGCHSPALRLGLGKQRQRGALFVALGGLFWAVIGHVGGAWYTGAGLLARCEDFEL